MPRYYCDYCDTYLTHDSPSVRKQHNQGYKHKSNVRNYFQQFEEQQTQSLIDEKVREHLGQAGVFPQVGAAFNQHLASLRYRPPLLRPPSLPVPGFTAPPMPLPPYNPPAFATPMATSGTMPALPVAPMPIASSQESIVPNTSTFYTTANGAYFNSSANGAYFNSSANGSAISLGGYQQQTVTLPPASSSGGQCPSIPAEGEKVSLQL